MTFEDRKKHHSNNSLEITPKMQSHWTTSLGWAIFLGLSGGIVTVITTIFLGRIFLRDLWRGNIYFNYHGLFNPYFIGFCLLFLTSLVANFYQLRFAFQLKCAINTKTQAAFEMAWLYFRNFTILFAVFILISTGMLFFSTVRIFTGY